MKFLLLCYPVLTEQRKYTDTDICYFINTKRKYSRVIFNLVRITEKKIVNACGNHSML